MSIVAVDIILATRNALQSWRAPTGMAVSDASGMALVAPRTQRAAMKQTFPLVVRLELLVLRFLRKSSRAPELQSSTRTPHLLVLYLV